MTISSEQSTQSYSGDGSTVTFPYGYQFFALDEVKVELRATDGTIITPIYNGAGTYDYTVSGTFDTETSRYPNGGSVTFNTAPPSGYTIALFREVTLTQETDYVANDAFPAETHENALDKLTMIAQQLRDDVDKSLRFTPTETASPTVPTVKANRILGADANGAALQWIDLANLLSGPGNVAQFPATLMAVQAIDTSTVIAGDVVYMRGRTSVGDGGEGFFKWDDSDLSAAVAAEEVTTGDGNGGINIAPSSDPTGASGAWVRQGASIVRPEFWGAVGDGSTDDFPALLAMRNWLVFNLDKTIPVEFDGSKIYTYSIRNWAVGIRHMLFRGNGCTFRYTGNAIYVFVTNGGAFAESDSATEGELSPRHYGYLINTVAAGSTAVTTTTAAEAGNFSVGDWALVLGLNQQSQVSFPPNARHFDYVKVTSVDAGTGQIGIDRQLTRKYRADWWEGVDPQNEPAQVIGPARIINLDRGTKNFVEDCYLEKIYFDYQGGTGSPDLNISGCYRADIVDCNVPGLTPSQCKAVYMRGGINNGGGELDKLLDKFEMDGVQWKIKLTGGTGVNRVLLKNSSIEGDTNSLSSRHVSVVDCDLHTQITSPNGFGCYLFHIKGCRFHTLDSDGVVPGHGAGIRSITVDSVPSSTQIAIPSNTTNKQELQRLLEGSLVWTDAGNFGRVSELYESGSDLIIEGTFDSAPQVGDVFKWSTTQRLVIEPDNLVTGLPPLAYTQFGRELNAQRAFGEQPARKEIVCTAIPVTGDTDYRPYVWGYVTRILVNVQKAYTGADAGSSLHVGKINGTVYADVNLKVAGVREVLPTTTVNAQSGDTLVPTGYERVDQAHVQSLSAQNGTDIERAKVMVIIESIPFVGPEIKVEPN